jgi:formylglycine-generating enzyme required for sulfatase activity
MGIRGAGPQSLIYPWGNTWDNSKANVGTPGTKPVASYENGKNWVGAYDMAGNVWEWVNDWYDATYYQQKIKNNPAGPTTGTDRVVRGGSWADSQDFARAAFRESGDPGLRLGSIGFRVVGGVPVK